MQIDFSELSGNRIYRLMTQVIVPRPVAWVLTSNQAGINQVATNQAGTDQTGTKQIGAGHSKGDGFNSGFNLAPFSYFNAVCSAPPLVMFSVGKKPDGSRKDTAVNIAEHKQFVVHIPSVEQAEFVTETSRSLPLGQSEMANIDCPLVAFDGFLLPRLADAPVAMGCELFEIQNMGKVPQQLIFAEIKTLYISDDVAQENDKGLVSVDAKKLNPIMRLGGDDYGSLGDIVTVPRPA